MTKRFRITDMRSAMRKGYPTLFVFDQKWLLGTFFTYPLAMKAIRARLDEEAKINSKNLPTPLDSDSN